MDNNQIYTIGHLFSNKIKRSFKIDFLIRYLKDFGVNSVLDLRYLKSEMIGSYATRTVKSSLENEGINYLSRVEETYLFFEVLKNVTDPFAKPSFFQSHYCLPLINYLKNIDTNHYSVALLFNYWETKDLIINSGKMRTNLKGGFSGFIHKHNVDLNILHLVPRKKGSGLDIFSNKELFEFAYGSLLDIREDMEWKRQPKTHNDDYYDPSDDLWKEVAENEWRGMNEESDGAAYWNID